jgi:hypothetical protein
MYRYSFFGFHFDLEVSTLESLHEDLHLPLGRPSVQYPVLRRVSDVTPGDTFHTHRDGGRERERKRKPKQKVTAKNRKADSVFGLYS